MSAEPAYRERPTRVLVVEDDEAIRKSVGVALELEGYDVSSVADGPEVETARGEIDPDVILLDVGLPTLDGLSVCRSLRKSGCDAPVLMLTARVAVSDRVAGLDAGADDYLVKPFDLDELAARLRALVRRSSNAWSGTLQLDDLRLNPAEHRAWRAGRELALTRTEFSLLRFLLEHAGAVVTPTQVYEAIWGYDFGPRSKNLPVYVGYLRRKLEEGGEPRLLHNVRGVGYTLRSP